MWRQRVVVVVVCWKEKGERAHSVVDGGGAAEIPSSFFLLCLFLKEEATRRGTLGFLFVLFSVLLLPFAFVGIKIDRQTQVDKCTWIYLNIQPFSFPSLLPPPYSDKKFHHQYPQNFIFFLFEYMIRSFVYTPHGIYTTKIEREKELSLTTIIYRQFHMTKIYKILS